MEHKSPKTSLILAFDPSGSLRQLSIPPPSSNESLDESSTDKSSGNLQSTAEVSYRATQLDDLASWLSLRNEASHDLVPVEIGSLKLESSSNREDIPEYFQMSPRKYRQLLRRSSHSQRESPLSHPIHYRSSATSQPKTYLFHIGVDKSPRVNWATLYCSQILNSKLAMVAKIEYSKAVASTLGGAYATLQRSGWAKLYAKQQLAIARVSGDEHLALRATVYLEICKIISILFPEYAERKVHQDDENNVTTTKTDTNATASSASAITIEQRRTIDLELEALMKKAKESGDEEIVGLVKYAMHRVKNAKVEG